MDDLPLQKIQISGPILASLIQRVSSSPGDVDGLLFGNVTHITPSKLTDDDPTSSDATTTTTSNIIATVTSFFSSTSTSTFYDSSGHLSPLLLRPLLHPSATLIGWFSARRRTHLRPSMRESNVTSSLSSQIQFSVPIQNSPNPYQFPPSIFLLLTTPFYDQIIHTHEYKAYQFRLTTQLFDPQTLDIVNIGPAFRGHYDAFSPASPFPAIACELRGSNGMAEDDKKNENLIRQKELDGMAEGFEVGRLSRLVGSEASNYTAELEDLYHKMLAKLDGLARRVETSSAKVLDQENHNMKLRYKLAGLE